MSGPGAISRSQAIKLKEYARLVSGLQEYQFASGGELIRSFTRLARTGITDLSLEQLLTETWGWLSQQISLSRLAVLCRVDSQADPCGLMIQRKQDGETEVARLELTIPASIREQLLDGKPYVVEDVRSGLLSDSIAKERYIHHILSEYYAPITTPNGVAGIAGFSAPSAGDYLAAESELLESVAAYISLWMQMDKARKYFEANPEKVDAHA